LKKFQEKILSKAIRLDFVNTLPDTIIVNFLTHEPMNGELEMAQRIYKAAAIYDCRIVGMRNLWEPSREYMGKPTEKPNYMAMVVVKKTRANWYEEPALANFSQACSELYNSALSQIPFQYVDWPIKDGDQVQPGRAQADWRMGHWVLTGSSSSPIEVSINQNGSLVPLRNQVDVKPGDYVMIGTALAVKMNDPRGVKCYLNKVVFMRPGEEIVVGTSVSATELMEQAKAQGMNVTGFGSGAPQQGFGFAPSGGGAPQYAPAQMGQTAGYPSNNFGAPPMGNGSAQTGAPAGAPATGQFGTTGQPGGSAFPSNSPQTGLAPPPMQPPGQPGYSAPGSFTPPTGFPQRQ
jgi:hypothetical protein